MAGIICGTFDKFIAALGSLASVFTPSNILQSNALHAVFAAFGMGQ
jgi:hypothetical protein